MTNKYALLDGFEIVASDGIPSITLDNQRRFYVNSSARRLMDVKPYQRLAIAYNPSSKSLAFVFVDARRGEYATSNYAVDKRYYMSARHFAGHYGYKPEGAPYNFVYERGASDGSVFVFRLV